MRKSKKIKSAEDLSEEELKVKLENYCAYRERCEQEVRQKMYRLQIPAEEQEDYLKYLKENNYLNDDRFIHAFTRGKFGIKHWGKNKIIAELRAKNIKENMIRQSFVQIDEGDYFMALLQLLEKKSALLKEQDPFKKKHKLFQFAMQKGYEAELIREAINTLKIG